MVGDVVEVGKVLGEGDEVDGQAPGGPSMDCVVLGS